MAKKPVKIKTSFNLKKLANNLDNIVVEGLNLQAKYLNDGPQRYMSVKEIKSNKSYHVKHHERQDKEIEREKASFFNDKPSYRNRS